ETERVLDGERESRCRAAGDNEPERWSRLALACKERECDKSERGSENVREKYRRKGQDKCGGAERHRGNSAEALCHAVGAPPHEQEKHQSREDDAPEMQRPDQPRRRAGCIDADFLQRKIRRCTEPSQTWRVGCIDVSMEPRGI